MKTQPYIPPPTQSAPDNASITDEFIISSIQLKGERKLLAPAAMLLMAQHIIAEHPFEAWPVDNSYQISFVNNLLTAPLAVRDAVSAIADVLAPVMNSLYDLVVADMKKMLEEAQQEPVTSPTSAEQPVPSSS
jgi:hypothetical protein